MTARLCESHSLTQRSRTNENTMDQTLTTMFLSAAGVLLGGIIGFSFGTIQNKALRNYKKKQAEGKLTSGWAVMPGSMRRTAYLLLLLAGIQLLCPILFEKESVQWLVSAGVVLGYGWTLVEQLRNASVDRA
jgi:hypothetical protein